MVFKNFLSKAKDIDILATIPDGIMLIDSSGKVEWINENVPLLFNLPKGDIFKLDINELIEGGLDLAKQAALSAKSAVGRSKIKQGKEIFFEIAAKAVEDFCVISLRDVTQSYKTVTNIIQEHESSKKVCKDKNAFLVKLSNELKSPIHSVIGFSQAMIDGLGGEMSEKQEKYIKIINKNSSEMLYLMDKILELSKTESNLMEVDFQIFDVINSTQNVLKNFEQQIKDKSLNLLFDTAELSRKTIYCDENSYKIILQNIMETSLAMTDIGSVAVKMSHPDADTLSECGFEISDEIAETCYLWLRVADTGAGLSEADLAVAFEPYAQLDRPNKKNIVRAIALACVKNLVKRQQGVAWINSEPMQGTVYNVIIPIDKQQ